MKSLREYIKEAEKNDFSVPIVLKEGLSQSQLIEIQSLGLPSLVVQKGFERHYADGPVFSSVLGYTGRVNANDIIKDPNIGGEEFIGKAGVEAFYDSLLRGEPGIITKTRDAKGSVIGDGEKSEPRIGQSLRLTIDSGLQGYFYRRLKDGLMSLGRRSGIGLAMDPQSGEVLALVNFPDFDNNIMGGPGNNDKKKDILLSPDKPLFNRAVSGFYNPGSTIKPFVAVAALKEKIISPSREIFSPGYIDIPNPYDPSRPTRYLDWRYQGNVNVHSAIAQSSNVYFYTVGGGAGEINGLGISKLGEWWKKFGFGKATGIDLPGESEGFLPSVEWKEKRTGKPWLLGDTYNVSIGQGDLLLSPLQLLSYIGAISNGGFIYKPVINIESDHPQTSADLAYLEPEMGEVRKGMRETVTSPLGTAYLLHDLSFPVAAKTGTAQVQGGAQENAIFVGYAPAYIDPLRQSASEARTPAGKPATEDEKPQIAILVLIENSREGSLNTVPIAKDVLNWYYWNRIRK